VRADSGRWHEVTASSHAHERQGLEHVRDALPDTEPYRAWSNFTFTSPGDGQVFEVDLLVIGPSGLHMVELKGWSGTISGFDRTWYELQPGWSKPMTRTNPVHLVNHKAKVFRSYLQAAAKKVKGQYDIPWITESVFLHGTSVDAKGLPESIRIKVFGAEDAQGNGLRRIVTDGLTASAQRGKAVDAQQSKAIERLLGSIGLKERPREVRVGQWVLEDDVLDAGWGWQDSPAHHASFENQRARVRRWFAPPGAGRGEIETLRDAASREFQLLGGLDHPGLVVPTEFEELDGAVGALVYKDLEGRRDLDAWMAENASVGMDIRLDLVRQLAEVMRYAHDHGLAHRGLGPRAITIRDVEGQPRLAVRDWQAAGRVGADQTTTHHAEALADHASSTALAFMAPEVVRGMSTDKRAADVFSVGVLAYLVLSGSTPATDQESLAVRLADEEGLMISSDLDSVSAPSEDFIFQATALRVDQRTPSMTELLADLDAAIDDLTAPEPSPAEAVDVLDAPTGTVVAGHLTIRRRLGEGASSVALLVERDGAELVLKVAKTDADRLAAEAEVLAKVPNSHLVAALREGPLQIGERTCLLIEKAGDQSLADRLRSGRLNLDLLRRFGRDLLEAVALLETAGISHRDIKPANLGVRTRSTDGKPHLVLFDFSLASAHATEVNAGTQGYRDPFLGTGKRRRHDPAAELFSAAVTLHEMATGRLPEWGDARSDPATLDVEVSIDLRLLDPSVADALAPVLRKALARDATQRYDTPTDLAAAWDQAFESIEIGDRDEADRRAEEATLSTPLESAGLSPRALSALEQYQVVTVGDLLELDPLELSRVPGATQTVKDELRARAVAWRARLTGAAEETPRQSVDGLVSRLIETSPAGVARRSVTLMLGRPDPESNVTLEGWPSFADVGDEIGVDKSEVREAWATLQSPPQARTDVVRLVDEVNDILEQIGEVATVDELAHRLRVRRGSHGLGDAPRLQSLGLVRLAVDSLESEQLAVYRKSGDVGLVAGTTGWDEPDRVLDEVFALSEVAERLAKQSDLPAPATCLDQVRAAAGEQAARLDDRRLLELATASQGDSAVSSRGEVYPVGLTAKRAVAICAPSLVTGGPVSERTIQARIKARFPRASELPQRVELQKLLDEAGLDLVWRDEMFMPRSATRSATHAGSSTAHTSAATLTAVDQALKRSVDEAGFLALGVAQRNMAAATHRLFEQHAVSVVDLSARLVDTLRRDAEESGGDWRFVLNVDAQPPSTPERRQLAVIVRASATEVVGVLADDNHPLLLTGGEVLARYGCVDLLAPLADLSADRPAARWLLAVQTTVGGTDLGGAAVPLAAPAQWLDLPTSWVRGSSTLHHQRGPA